MNCAGVLICFAIFGSLVSAMPQHKIFKVSFFEKCLQQTNITETASCVVARTLKYFETIENEQNLELLPGVTLEKNLSAPRLARKIEPSTNSTGTSRFLNILLDFVSDRTLKIKLPPLDSANVARALEEGRRKVKKTMGGMFMNVAYRMMGMIPVAFLGLVLFTTKALVVGKLAFVISLIVFLQMFILDRGLGFSGTNFLGGGGTYNIPTTYGSPAPAPAYGTPSFGGWGGPYSRSIDEEH